MKKNNCAKMFIVVMCELFLTASPLSAGYYCGQIIKQNEGSANLQLESVGIARGDQGQNPIVSAFWASHLGFLPQKGTDNRGGLARLFRIDYSGPIEAPWEITSFRVNFPTYLKLPLKPLYVFLTLESGVYFQKLITDSKGGAGTYLGGRPVTDQTVASFNVHEKTFLSALGKSKVMAVDFKYADGETLLRETYNVSRPAVLMQGALNAALEMDKDFKKKCRYIDPYPQVEF